VPLAERLALDDAGLAPVRALVACNARVRALVEIVVKAHTSFYLHDFVLFPGLFLRGKRGEPWNRGARVVGARDVCLAASGGGDLYVWNADSGEVRLLRRDRGWQPDWQLAGVDRFVEQAMLMEVEKADPSHVEAADDGYRARLRLAVQVAGDDMLDDGVRAALEARP
jgi:hypothetical protein